MSNELIEPKTAQHRLTLAIGIVVLSIVLPTGLIGWSVLAEMRDKGVAWLPSKTVRDYFGSVKQGELWYTEFQAGPNRTAMLSGVRIMRLNLETGEERDSGLAIPSEFGGAKWIGGKLYYLTSTALYRQSDNQFVKLADLSPRPDNFYADVFLFDGHLTTIRPTDDGGHRLLHLSGGKWIDGRPIMLPETDCIWHDDEQRGRRVVLPRTSQQPVLAATRPPNYFLQVISDGEQQHVMLNSYSFAAYRNGFEFADEVNDEASALSPDNASHDVTGWESIGTPRTEYHHWAYMSRGRDGLYFLEWGTTARIAHRSSSGSWSQFQAPITKGVTKIHCDPDDATTYVIGADQTWGSAEVSHLGNNTAHPVHLTIRGCEREYLARWKRLAMSLFVAWLLHITLLIGGAAWLTRDAARSGYEFGNQQTTLAPLWRRAIATGVDVVLGLATAAVLGRLLFTGLSFPKMSTVDKTQLANDFFSIEFNIEQTFVGAITGMPVSWRGPDFDSLIDQFLQSLFRSPDLILIINTVLLILFGISVFMEGRHGITPGKWLLGVRTVRTTLRPCGFARAVVRNVVCFVDLPLLLTPLPAAISLMFSDHRQRLGDRVADTIVVRAGSVREAC